MKSTDFLRLKNISVSYELPRKWVRKVNLKGLSIFFHGRNLAVWDKIKEYDFDPEKGHGFSPYPQTRTFSFGTTITF